MAFTAFPPNPPIDTLVAKGDLLTHDGSSDIIKSIGSDGDVLKALSTNPSGLDWSAILEVPSGGTTGQILTKTATGYEWQTPTGGGMQIHQSLRYAPSNNQSYTVPSGMFSQLSRETQDINESAAQLSAGAVISMNNFFGTSNVTIDGDVFYSTNNFYKYIVTFKN